MLWICCVSLRALVLLPWFGLRVQVSRVHLYPRAQKITHDRDHRRREWAARKKAHFFCLHIIWKRAESALSSTYIFHWGKSKHRTYRGEQWQESAFSTQTMNETRKEEWAKRARNTYLIDITISAGANLLNQFVFILWIPTWYIRAEQIACICHWVWAVSHDSFVFHTEWQNTHTQSFVSIYPLYRSNWFMLHSTFLNAFIHSLYLSFAIQNIWCVSTLNIWFSNSFTSVSLYLKNSLEYSFSPLRLVLSLKDFFFCWFDCSARCRIYLLPLLLLLLLDFRIVQFCVA